VGLHVCLHAFPVMGVRFAGGAVPRSPESRDYFILANQGKVLNDFNGLHISLPKPPRGFADLGTIQKPGGRIGGINSLSLRNPSGDHHLASSAAPVRPIPITRCSPAISPGPLRDFPSSRVMRTGACWRPEAACHGRELT